MSRIGYGYGSEWHLLRWMGRHRQEFDRRVINAVARANQSIEWLDCGSNPANKWPDAEIKGLDFLPASHSARIKWQADWPQTGNVPNWDAVGRLVDGDGQVEWLLVEAKAHEGELLTSCGAKAHGGRLQIEQFLDHAKSHLGVAATFDWLTGHYQYANRVAILSFLERQGIRARLLFVYFTGEKHPGWNCPATEQQWQSSLNRMKTHLGLTTGHYLSGRIHDIFPPVA